jgi:hypothetical protein
MQRRLMALEQEAIAWLLAVAFARGSWGVRHPLLAPEANQR